MKHGFVTALALGLALAAACGGGNGGDSGTVGGMADGSTNVGSNGAVEVLARLPGFSSGKGGPMGIALAGGFAYVSVFSAAADVPVVAKLPVQGGTVESLVAGPGSSSAVAVQDGTAYFGDDRSQAVRAVPVTGGDSRVLTDESGADDITVAGDTIYVADANVGGTGLVAALSTAGGPLRELLRNEERPLALVLDGNALFVGHLGPSTSGNAMAKILRLATEGGAPEAIASSLEGVRALVVDERSIFATIEGATDGEGQLMAIDRMTGARTVLADKQPGPWGLAADVHSLYWVNRGLGGGSVGSVHRIAKTGGAITILATQQGEPRKCAVDADYIYWTNFSTGEIMRVRKPAR